MEIIKTNLDFKSLSKREKTDMCIIHHTACSYASPEDIHRWHLNNGWSGAGYNLYIRKDGKVYELRPIDCVGAHAQGYNSRSVGVCFEGNFEEEEMTNEQVESGKQVVAYVKSIYGDISFKGHRDVNSTSCPGSNFKFDEIVYGAPAPSPEPQPSYSYEEFVGDVQKAIGVKVDRIAGPITLAHTPTVSRYKNDKHAVVIPIQKYLYSLGYTEVGKADGYACGMFEKAVKHYQSDNGCVVDGEITAKCKTWKKLLKLI